MSTNFIHAAAARIVVHMQAKLANDDGLSTIEYAFGTLAAAALAGVLYMVVTSNGVSDAIEGVITDALTNKPG
ncbi:hypothetical protein BJP08_10605 [Corynebacterium sp. NML140438]|nr:hypothetical protein BJP08_10605 [Corynebacterium sp. NML140438]